MRNLIIALLITFKGYSQQVNKTNDGYTEVVEVELSKKEIHQKLNEWIAVNYKSAQDVIQLNTEDKIIIKGNFSVNFSIKKYVFKYRIHNALSFSIRDNKFKIDLVPNSASSDGVGSVDSSVFKQYITDVIYTKDEFLKYSVVASMKIYLGAGFSEKKSQKMINRYVVSAIDENYENFLKNKPVWDNSINSTFKSIKDYVNKSNTDEDW
jgi:hypothetical protein